VIANKVCKIGFYNQGCFLSLAAMNTAYLLLGSNEGDRLQHLSQALNLIHQKAGTLVNQSAIYVTVAWGNSDQPDFLNQVISVTTALSPLQLLKELLAIEQEIGRTRTGAKWMQRIIDIDILFYNDLVMATEELTIPHPFIQDRRFVLVPLGEIAAGYVHPVFQKNIAALTEACSDKLEVQKLMTILH
jgi:2-amino-4-hydroxy-6-hydroxymethyldihydropteridine diphosphokinase